jgi:methylenetetrahydrofolate reductase (NADPH)
MPAFERICEAFGRGQPVFSFEFFPPKTDAGFQGLYETIADLKRLEPGFVSVTWGAGGSTRRKTVELVTQIQRELGITAMAHLSCVGSDRVQLTQTLDQLESAGIRNVLPLGGDRPAEYTPPPDALEHASDLVELIRARPEGRRFCLAGACYPETHPRASSPDADLRWLVHKVRAGVDFLITQLFFDDADYFAFVARARAAGIDVPIVPGVMPVISARNVRRMAGLSGARIPEDLSRALDACEDDDARTLEVGIEWATLQCRQLLAGGAPGIHFYTLNRSPAARRIRSVL